MSQNYTIRKTLKKRRIAKNKKQIRLYDQGTKRLVILQRRFIRTLEKYFKQELRTRSEYIDTIPELSVSVEKYAGKDVLVRKILTPAQEKALFASATNVIRGAMSEGVKEFTKEMPTNKRFKVGFGLKSKQIIEYADTRAGELIKGLDETTRKKVMFLISTAIKNGDTVADLKKSLQANFTFSKYRAGLIASTELGGAYLEGKKQSFKETLAYYGMTEEQGRKQVTVHDDDRICPICQPCVQDVGKWIRFNQPFSNGLLFAIFHIGCRCNCTFSMFNPDGDETFTPASDKQKPNRVEAPTPEEQKEATEPTKLSDVEVMLEPYFILSPSLRGMPFSKAVEIGKGVEEMYKTMPFLDRVPKLSVASTTKSMASVSRNGKREVTELTVSKKSIGTGEVGVQAHNNRYSIKMAEDAIESYKKYGGNERSIKKAEELIERIKLRSDDWTITSTATEVKDRVRLTIVHEFGHILDFFIKRKSLNKDANYDFFQQIISRQSKVFAELKKIVHEQKNPLTEYAKTNDNELFAEAWSAYINQDFHRITPDVKDFFDDVLDLLRTKYAV